MYDVYEYMNRNNRRRSKYYWLDNEDVSEPTQHAKLREVLRPTKLSDMDDEAGS